MKNKNKLGQESAFPIFLQEGLSNNSHVDAGMSKRFYAACAAMQGMLASNITTELAKNSTCSPKDVMNNIILAAFEFADELLKQEYGE